MIGQISLYYSLQNSIIRKDNCQTPNPTTAQYNLNVITKMALNTSLAVKGAPAHRLQRRTACKIQYGRK